MSEVFARDVALLAEQAISLGAEFAVTADPARHGDLAARLAGTGIATAAGSGCGVEVDIVRLGAVP